MRRLLQRISRSLPVRIIERRDGLPYLERFYLFRVWRWTFFLHKFVSSDPEGEVHDHPWNSLSIMLVGSYLETRWLGGELVEFKRTWVNLIKGETFHRVTLFEKINTWAGVVRLEQSCWTLFIHAPRFKGWGFLRRLSLESGGESMTFYSYTPVPRGKYEEEQWYHKKNVRRGRDLNG